MSDGSERLKALIDEIEEFPHTYTLKFIGVNSDRFASSIERLESKHDRLRSPTKRESLGGRHLAVTYVVVVQSSQEILDLYALVRELDDLVMML